MSDLEAAMVPVREILERYDASRRNGSASTSSMNWELFYENLAAARKVAERLRNGAH